MGPAPTRRVSGLPAEAVARFRADLVATLGSEPAGTLALAVSGGPDSMAMLALAHAAFDGRVIAATVDHGLRPESVSEAAMVADWCRTAAIAHRTLAVPAPPGATGNLQGWARQERYLLLKRWAIDRGATALCTAHHAEDQAETLLMRAARGSGLSGLASVRARTDEHIPVDADGDATSGAPITVRYAPLTLLRPLLGWRRADLRAMALAGQVPFVDDPSNRADGFDRTRFRRWLESAPWIDPVRIGRSAAHLAEAESDILAISHWLWDTRALPSGDFEARFDVADLPRGVRRYLARRAIEHVRLMLGMGAPPPANVEALLDALDAGKRATQADVMASADGSVWHFREAPPRRSH